MAMRIDILTLFPEFFDGFRNTSIPGRAVRNGFVDIRTTNIRDFAIDRYGSVDDAPFGGGPGMVLRCEPVYAAIEQVRKDLPDPPGRIIMMTPQGRALKQNIVKELAGEPRLIFLAGHYEGFDERIRTTLVDDEISLGDFVLSGGEIAAMALTDAVIRLLPGALGKDASSEEESFSAGLLEYPHYTRPREFMDQGVPEVLLNGDHAKIEKWRLEQSELRTRQRRPDLWEKYLQQMQDDDKNKNK